MNAIVIFMVILLSVWVGVGLVQLWKDYKFRKKFDAIKHEDWRRVPPPNWASSRKRLGGDFW